MSDSKSISFSRSSIGYVATEIENEDTGSIKDIVRWLGKGAILVNCLIFFASNPSFSWKAVVYLAPAELSTLALLVDALCTKAREPKISRLSSSSISTFSESSIGGES